MSIIGSKTSLVLAALASSGVSSGVFFMNANAGYCTSAKTGSIKSDMCKWKSQKEGDKTKFDILKTQLEGLGEGIKGSTNSSS